MRIYTTEIFKKISNQKHNNKYDYSLVSYVNKRSPVFIICPFHGTFNQIAGNHLLGRGCPKCGFFNISKSKTVTEEKLKNKLLRKYGDLYDLSNLNFNGYYSKISVGCKIHKIFWQLPNTLLQKGGCPRCSYVNITKTQERFKQEASQIHNNFFDYSKVNYRNGKTKITIICPYHGDFNQSPTSHLSGSGCPICKESKGEKKIAAYLTINNIIYHREVKFNTCKNKRKLPFDFGIFDCDNNLLGLIEYQGKQHFGIGGWSSNKEQCNKEFKEVQNRDKIKRAFCLKRNIPLLEIPYTDFNKVDKCIEIFLNRRIFQN